jgi:hypothetical protein
MLLAGLLTLFLAPVTIYVGPEVKDGFVETDKGVQDSVTDLRAALTESPDVKLVAQAGDASLKLYIVRRQRVTGPSGGVGEIARGTGTTVSAASTTYVLETKLVAGTYERTFTTEKNDQTEWSATWKGVAKSLAKDVSAWLAANRERVAGQ